MKESIQRVGGAMSGMVIPNIGAFIAWGLITALYIQLVGHQMKICHPWLDL